MLPGKALVRWGTGKRLTDRLPKLSRMTRPPLATAEYSSPDRIYDSGGHATNSRFQFLWAQGEHLSGFDTVSYTHLTLPTICSV